MPKIFITGDIHQSIDIGKFNRKHFPIGKTLTKEDIVIILGDAGLVWDNSNTDKYWRKWLNDKPWTTFCILGNHENYNLIGELPQVDFMGARAMKVEDSVFYANTGTIYNIYGHKILAVNGADSTDKEYRKENVSWWKQERITPEDVDKAIAAIKDNDIEYLLTHTGGSEVSKTLGFAPTPSDIQLDRVIQNIKGDFKHFCGHYHVDAFINSNTKILYDDIILLHDTECDIDDGGLCSIYDRIV